MGTAQNQQSGGGNQPYLKTWDKYSNSVADKRKTLLLPINIWIEDGKIKRERMNAKDVKSLYAKGRKTISEDWFNNPKLLPNPDKAVKHYLNYFRQELNENPFLPPNPLDLVFNRPTLLLIAFNHKNWRFTKGRGYRVHNDNSDHTRNFIDVAQMDNRKGLMFLNRHYSDPKGLKFDLCVDVKQKSEAGVNMVTPIIIDPGGDNPGHTFP